MFRPAFVSLIAADPNGNILTRQAGQQQVTIKPAQFVLESPSGNAEDGQKRHEKVCCDFDIRASQLKPRLHFN
jgi:hypothetical protein